MSMKIPNFIAVVLLVLGLFAARTTDRLPGGRESFPDYRHRLY